MVFWKTDAYSVTQCIARMGFTFLAEMFTLLKLYNSVCIEPNYNFSCHNIFQQICLACELVQQKAYFLTNSLKISMRNQLLYIKLLL